MVRAPIYQYWDYNPSYQRPQRPMVTPTTFQNFVTPRAPTDINLQSQGPRASMLHRPQQRSQQDWKDWIYENIYPDFLKSIPQVPQLPQIEYGPMSLIDMWRKYQG